MKAHVRAIFGLFCLTSCYSIEISPREPEAPIAADDQFTTAEDQPLTITFAELLANDSDPNADTLSIADTSIAATGGSVALSTDSLVFTPTANFNGTASFSYTVNDGAFDDVATVTITVTSVNDPPIADPLTTGTTEDTPVLMSFTGTDVEGDAISFDIVSQPLNGTVAPSNGSFLYTPNQDFFGDDTFTIAGADASGTSTQTANVQVTVLPVNDAPVAVNDSLTTSEFDVNSPPISFTLAATDVDDAQNALDFVVIGFPENGVLDDSASPTLTFKGTPDFFSPVLPQARPEVVTFLVFDAAGDVSIGEVDITITNVQDPPVVTLQTAKIQREGTTKTYTLIGTDADNDPLIFRRDIPVGSVPIVGTFVGLDNGANTDQIASFTYTAPALGPTDPSIDETFFFVANDGAADSAPPTPFLINVRSDDAAPTAVDDTLTTNEDNAIVINESVLVGNDTDPDNDPLNIEPILPAFSNTVNCVPTLSNGVVTITFAQNFNGSASFDYLVTDSLIPDTGHVSITVNAVNDAPVNTTPGAQTAAEDTNLLFSAANNNRLSIADVDANQLQETLAVTNGTITLGSITGLSFTAGDGTADATMTFTGTLNNINAALATVTFIPTADFNGASTLTMTTSDQGNTGAGGTLIDTDIVNITITEVNDPPVAGDDTGPGTLEDTQLSFAANTLLTNDSKGPANENAQTLTLTLPSGTTTLGGTVALSNGTITYNPPANANGADTFTYTVTDDGTTNGAANPKTDTGLVTINVTVVNDQPFFNAITDLTVNEDVGSTNVAINGINAGPANESAQIVTVTAVSNNTALIPNPTISGAGSSRTLAFQPVANQSGSAVITVTATDDGGTANGGVDTFVRTFTITVNTVNDPPSFDVIADQNVLEDASSTNVAINNINAGPANESAQIVTVTAVSNNTALIPNPTISGAGSSRTLAFQPVANQSGSAVITVTATDDGGTANGGNNTFARTFTITVTAVNDQPAFDPISNQTVNEDATTTNLTITNVSTGPNEAAQAFLVFSATSNNTAIVPNPVISGSGTTRNLAFTPAANANGTVTITVTAQDNGGTANGGVDTLVRTFTITVNAVNDPPSFDVIANQTVNEDSGTTNVSITNVSPGPSDESAQTVTVTATSSNPAIVPNPTVTAAGATRTLSFAPVANQNGVVTITVTAQDNGGGTDTFQRTFTISVTAVNDAPVNTVPGAQTTTEDTSKVFSAGNSNQISVADIDAGAVASNITETITVTNGTITLGSTAGLTFTSGSNNSAAMTFTGTLANINAALATTTFVPTANANTPADGLAVITLTSNDKGNTGGGDQIDIDTINVTITEVNDAPSATADTTAAVLEDAAATNITIASLIANDSKGPANENAQTLTLNLVAGTTSLGGTVVVSGANVVYTPAANTNGNDTFTYTVTDNGTTNGAADAKTSAAATVTIPLTAVNDAPVNAVPGAQTTNEDTNKVFSAGNSNLISVADIDVAAAQLQETITAVKGTVTLGSTTGLTFTVGNGVADATMTFTGTLANINAALATVTFIPTPDDSGAGSITLLTSDQGNTGSGGALSDSDVITVNITAVNDAPVNTVPGAQTTTEDTNKVFSAANSNLISVADVDVAAAQLQETITVTNGTITLGSTAGLTFTSGSNNSAAMTFTGTLANVNAALATTTFVPTADANTPANGLAVLTIVSNDQGNTGGAALSDTDVINITITEVNDAPVAIDDIAAGVLEDAAATNITIASLIANDSKGPANENAQTLTLTLPSGTTTLGGTVVVSGANVVYTPALNTNGPDSFTYTVTDNGTTNGAANFKSATGIVTIDITAVNDAPVNTVPGAQTTAEDTNKVFSAANSNQISVADIDAGAVANNITETITVVKGTLTLGSITGLSFTVGDGTADATMTFTGTLANINAALATVTFIPTPDDNGAGSITLLTSDQGNTGSGGAKTDTDVINITINAVNDAPAFIVPNNQNAFDTDGVINLTINSVSTGPANESGQAFTSFTATSSNTAIVPNPVISGAGATRNLAYDPVLTKSGTVTITVTAVDDGGTANGGVNTTVHTFDITVASCGGGEITTGELCDDGAQCQNGTACATDANCAGIGDGLCKARSGDGCSATCQVETGFNCFNVITAESDCVAVNATTVNNEDGSAAEADNCTLDTATVSVAVNATTTALLGGVKETDLTGHLTTGTGNNAGIRGEVGFGPAGANPTTTGGWAFFLSSFSADNGANIDDYSGTILAPSTAGTFDFTYRFTFDNGLTYTYCDTNGAGSDGGQNFDTNQLGTMTVTP